MSIETMKQALKAFEVATTPFAKDRQEVIAAITALRQAIEQPAAREQDKYTAPSLSTLKHGDHCRYWIDDDACNCGAVEFDELKWWRNCARPQPAAWVGLTSQHLNDIFAKASCGEAAVLRAAEILRELNTAPQPVDEPVAWGFHMKFNNGREHTFKGLADLASCKAGCAADEEITLLYTHPQQGEQA